MISYIFFILLITAALTLSTLISVTDFRRRIIPDAYLFPLMLIGLILVTFYRFPISIANAVIGASFGYALATIVGFLFDSNMRKQNKNADIPIGMGDIKLIGVGGIWLGTNGLAIALIIACILGAIWSRTNKQRFIPFAPFFLLGGFLSLIGTTFLL